MARSRHSRSGGGPSTADPRLPSWAQRHLDEASDTGIIAAVPAPSAPSAPPTRHHRRAAVPAGGLRGWGVAIVSVAAAVSAVPLAVSSLANDHSDDPLPNVDTYTAGSPGPLQSEPGGGTRAGTPGTRVAPGQDSATAGVSSAPPEAPEARAARPVPVPVPAAVIRPTRAVVPAAAPAIPRSATSTAPTSTTQGPSGTTTTKPAQPPARSAPEPPPESSDDGGSSGGGNSDSGNSGGGLLGGVGNTVGGLTKTVGGVAGSLGL
jgi:hypothetical protein